MYTVQKQLYTLGVQVFDGSEEFYLIKEEILPDSIRRTLKAKKYLESGRVKTVNEAAEKAGISRSVYYKYKDKIFPFNAATYQKVITVSLILEHRPGVLSKVLQFVAAMKGNVITINQSIPLQGLANVVLSIDSARITVKTTEFIDRLVKINGVQRAVVVGEG